MHEHKRSKEKSLPMWRQEYDSKREFDWLLVEQDEVAKVRKNV